ncbi:MAG: DsrE family protein [Actinobacteria bacterium]|nr:DsrE family protein [Actinomycetota bacterium]
MADKVFVILSSQDREVLLEVGLTYPFNTAKNGWMDDVRIILFGPSEKLVVHDAEVQSRLREAMAAGIRVMACKWCSDRMGVTEQLEDLGIEVLYVGSVISDLLKAGWAGLTF